MEHRDRHRRDEDREVQPEGADQEQHEADRHQIRPIQHIAEPLDEGAGRPHRARGGAQLADAQRHQREEHGGKRGAVEHEHPAGADDRDQHAGDGRADHPGERERGRVQGDRVRQIVVADEIGDEGLAHRRVEGRRAAEQQRECVDVPQPHEARHRERAERQRQDAHRRLRRDQQLAAVETVRRQTGPRQEEQLRAELQAHDDADGGGAPVGQPGEDEPVLRRALQPRPDVRDERAGRPDPVVADGERAEGATRGHDAPGASPPCRRPKLRASTRPMIRIPRPAATASMGARRSKTPTRQSSR